MREALFNRRKWVVAIIILVGLMFLAAKDYKLGTVEGLLGLVYAWSCWPHRRESELRVPTLLAAVTAFVVTLACSYVVIMSG